MATEEAALALEVGDINYLKMTGLLPYSLSYGMYLIVLAMSIAIIRNRKTGLLGGKALLWLLTILAIITTLSFSSYVAALFLDASWSQLGSPGQSLEERLALARENTVAPGLIYSLTSPTIYMIADFVALWRAYVLWMQGSRPVKFLLIGAALVNFAFWVINTVLRGIGETRSRKLDVLTIVQLLLSTAINALASLLFGIKAWQHHAKMRKSSMNVSSSRLLKILLVVMEGGFVLCFFQLLSSIMYIRMTTQPVDYTLSSLRLAQVVTDAFTDHFAAAYPSVVIVIIAFQNSTLNTSNIYSNSDAGSNTAFFHITANPPASTGALASSKAIQITTSEQKDYSYA